VSTFLATFFIAIVLLSLASIFILEVESPHADANIGSGRDAFWWAFVTVTTVGYGDRVPVSWPGQFIAMILMVVGVGVFGVLTSSLASWFVATEEGGRSSNIAAIRYDVDGMKDELAAKKGDVAEIKRLLQERSQCSSVRTGKGKQN
jgi:voltage-gated potassium channel